MRVIIYTSDGGVLANGEIEVDFSHSMKIIFRLARPVKFEHIGVPDYFELMDKGELFYKSDPQQDWVHVDPTGLNDSLSGFEFQMSLHVDI